MEDLIRRLEARASVTVERLTGETLTVKYLGTMQMHETGERRVVLEAGDEVVAVPLRLVRRLARKLT